MRISYLATALAAVPALAAPAKRQSTNIDATVLQFALTLEHLENYYYSTGLSKLSRAQFVAAGFTSAYYDQLRRIADDEKNHVSLLSSALTAAGQTPVVPCTYNFESLGVFNDPKAFVGVIAVIEGVGTSAYLGGAPLITSKTYLGVAGSILVTEALHTSLQRSQAALVPFPEAYGTALDPTSVYTAAAAFIASCPSANAGKVPFTPYPSLGCTKSSTQPAVAGATLGFSVAAGKSISAGSYATFISGLDIVSVPVTGSGQTVSAAIPANGATGGPNDIAGQTYVLITSAKSNGTMASAGNVIAGPAIIEVVPAAPMTAGS